MSLAELYQSFRRGEIPKEDYIRQMHARHAVLFEYADYIQQADLAEISIQPGRVVMITRRHRISLLCDPADIRMAPLEILNFLEYEQEHVEMAARLAQDNSVILDVGANVGWYSLVLAGKFPGAQVHAFEPLPRTFEYLQENVALNRLDNIILHNFGLSDEEKILEFFYEPDYSSRASAANLSGREDIRKISCQVKPLDCLVPELVLRVDFIKCDCEGAELFVFKGALRTLERFRPVVFTEMLRRWSAKFGYHPNQIIELFAGLGYRCYTVAGKRLRIFEHMDDQTVDTNFFFLHPTQHREQLSQLAQEAGK